VCYGIGLTIYDELLPAVDQATLLKKRRAPGVAAERAVLLT
jgi:hypothetical protein